jgi:hypothetical protein
MVATALMRIRGEHKITLHELAREAMLPLRTVFHAGIGKAVEEMDARKLADAVSRLTGRLYTLGDLGLNIVWRDRVPTRRLPRVH